MLITIKAAKCIGIDAIPIIIEIHIEYGIGLHLVGLGDIAVKESLLRITTALSSIGVDMPGCKIIINLAPADTRKNGSGYDLPIAIGILMSSTYLKKNENKFNLPLLGDFIIMGELGLDGSVREVSGALPVASLARDMGLRGCILPRRNALETVGYDFGEVYGVDTIQDVITILSGSDEGQKFLATNLSCNGLEETFVQKDESIMDFSDIIGQEVAKRGMEIAASGGHNVLLIGSPGSGKSSLAKAAGLILPPLTPEESLQTSKIFSVAGKNISRAITQRPFRSPHYSISMPALLGGGSDVIAPGEISLAHNGILFIDEFCEAPKRIIDALRAPLEDRSVTISRLKNKVTYPANFMLVAATNPCPCGHYKDGDKCTCTPAKREAYLSKLSGPIMDRLDLQIFVRRVETKQLLSGVKAETTAEVLARVVRTRRIQELRFAGTGITTNSQMSKAMIDQYCTLDDESKAYFEKAIDKYSLSARSYGKVLKIARTIADIAQSENILLEHLYEAVCYRKLDEMH